MAKTERDRLLLHKFITLAKEISFDEKAFILRILALFKYATDAEKISTILEILEEIAPEYKNKIEKLILLK